MNIELKSMHVNYAMVKNILILDFFDNKNLNRVTVSQFSFILHYVVPKNNASINNFIILLF